MGRGDMESRGRNIGHRALRRLDSLFYELVLNVSDVYLQLLYIAISIPICIVYTKVNSV